MRLASEGNIIVYPLIVIFGITSAFNYLTEFDILFVQITIFVVLLFCLNFFRDPSRVIPKNKNTIISPADGKIIKIKEFEDPKSGKKLKLISIFLSVFNVHANRMPVDGKFINVKYVKGDFLAAFDHRASDKNERMEISIDTEFGIIVVKQIAGLVARRILCYAKEGKKMLAGDRLGFIRFGSRTDIILPHNINLNIELNQKVYGGETILGTYES
ncbi:phosphatidylserine decarboxylase family protein [Candidatus Marinimicrobia bacterium]|nr:phosphatidylserine decarboxylase family protein [Candidatus Neomarinimicrobiota bacterium]